MTRKGNENLRSFHDMPEEEARKIQSKGGKASVTSRRQKANIQKTLEAILKMEVPEGKMKEALRGAEIPTTMEYAVVFSVIMQTLKRGRTSDLACLRGMLDQNLTLADKREQKARIARMNAETKVIEEQMKRDEQVEDEGLKRFLELSRTEDIKELFNDEANET